MRYRYRNEEEMKYSGIKLTGDIPKGWTVGKAQYYFNVYAGGTPNTNEPSYWDGNIPWINSGEVQNCLVQNVSRYITEKGLNESSTKLIPTNTTLLAMTGATCGNVGYLTFESTANQSVMAFSKLKDFHSKYLYYYLMCQENQILYFKTGGAQGGINVDNGKKIYLNVPTLMEQIKISTFLDEKTAQFDSIISKKEELIQKLEEAKKSLISEVVTGKVKVVKTFDGYELVERKKEEMRDSGVEWLGEIPIEWEIKKIKNTSKILRVKFNHRPRNDPEYYNGKYPFIQTGDVAKANMYITKYSQTLNEKGYSVSKEFAKGTLVMTIAANIGDIAILDFNACFPDSVVGFVPNKDMDLKYMYYTYIVMKYEFMSTAIINTQMNLNVERIEKLMVVVPTLEVQEVIVRYLEEKIIAIGKVIEKTHNQIEKIKEAKQSLISEAVTGKIEILD